MASEEKPSQEVPDQLFEEISNKHDILATYEPPSPLTGCYLLIILGEPHSSDHKDIILQRLLKGNFPLKMTSLFGNITKITFKIRQSFTVHKLTV